MEKLVWMLLVLLAFHFQATAFKDTDGWVNIDCGSDKGRFANEGIWWDTDTSFTTTGVNKRVPQGQPLEEMNTLRSFPDQKKQNCYTLPSNTIFDDRFLIRAGFYYGNYDGHSKPPTFDLHLDGMKWATVDTSSAGGGPIYHEAYHMVHSLENISVCLVQTRGGEVPFISSLEVVPIDDLYSQMVTNSTYFLVTRSIFGVGEVRDDDYNRIWTSAAVPPNCIHVSSTSSSGSPDNEPPLAVLNNNVQSQGPSDPIILSVDLPHVTLQPAYVVLYLSDVATRENYDDTRIVQIYINGQEKDTVSLGEHDAKAVTIDSEIAVGPTMKIILATTNNSTLPPIISAMEVFTNTVSGPPPNSARQHLSPRYFVVLMIFLLFLLM